MDPLGVFVPDIRYHPVAPLFSIMQETPRCPVCDKDDWKCVKRRRFASDDASRLSPAMALRYRVLFEVWFPERTHVEITVQQCRHCGVFILMPRPTSEDIKRKYDFLLREEPIRVEFNPARAKRLYRLLAPFLESRKMSVLDFGGGTGKLLTEFVNRGHRCHTLDYVSQTIPGVEWLGATLNEIPEHARFDLIVCSHVLEHVANPFEILERLRDHLTESGVLFIEVPDDIRFIEPHFKEPVTHTTFFTLASIGYLCRRAGLDVVRCTLTNYRDLLSGHVLSMYVLARRLPVSGCKTSSPAARHTRQTWHACKSTVRSILHRFVYMLRQAFGLWRVRF